MCGNCDKPKIYLSTSENKKPPDFGLRGFFVPENAVSGNPSTMASRYFKLRIML
jgi:hypothetical protein